MQIKNLFDFFVKKLLNPKSVFYKKLVIPIIFSPSIAKAVVFSRRL